MKALHARFGDQIQFLDVVIRQAHPGGKEPPYRTFAQKMADAQAYQREEDIPWPVLVDDLEGSVHQAWGGLSDPAYLLDREGRVALYCTWTSGSALRRGMEELLAQGGRGIVAGGLHRPPEVGPMLTDGWRALQRGLPGSAVDMMIAIPFSPAVLWLGYQLKPVLGGRARLAQRRRPRRLALLAAGAVALGLLARRVLRPAR